MVEKRRRWRGLFVAAAIVAVVIAWIGVAIAWFPRVGGWHAQDLSLYRSAAQHVLNGQVPYRDFGLEYPPGAFRSNTTAWCGSRRRSFCCLTCAASVLWRLRPLAAENRVMPGIANVGSANHLDSPTP
jgi:hypothetical protein